VTFSLSSSTVKNVEPSDFDLESWLADLLVNDWLERNQEMSSRQTDRCPETVARAKKENQKPQGESNGIRQL